MIVVDPDAVQRHPAVMIVFNATLIADGAVMHPGHFVYLALLTKSPPLAVYASAPVVLTIIFEGASRTGHEVFGQMVVYSY
jgi:hypothetical protein